MLTARGAWKEAVAVYEEAIAAGENLLNLSVIARVHDGLAHAYQRLGQPAVAMTYSRRALTRYEAQADRAAICRAEKNLGDLYLRQGRLDLAGEHLNRALALADALGLERRGRSFILDNLATLALRRGDLDLAEQRAAAAEQAALSASEPSIVANACAMLGRVAERRGDHTESDQHFVRAISILA